MPIFQKVILFLVTLLSGAWAQGPASIEVTLSSRMVVVGEQTRLSVQINNASILDWPDSPNAAPLALTRTGQNRIVRNGRIQEVFEYSVSAFREGSYTIPPFKVRTQQGVITSKSISLKVFPVSALATKGITIRPTTVPYLSGIFLEKTSPYVGETQNVEAKLYVPESRPHLLKLYNGQVINMEKDGIAAWRFTADRRATGALNYDGLQFQVYTYRSSLNALREGDLAIGPGKAEPVFQMRSPARGGFGNVAQAFPIEFPAAHLKVRPLPEGAPEGFSGAVGDFNLEALTTARELKLGDTITVESKVTGSGNIDQFPGPVLVDPEENWKQFEMIAKPPGSERRSSSGTVEFSQVVRPMKNLPALPPYRFVFFDPILEKFRTLETPPQPLTMTGEAVATENSDSGLAFLTPAGRSLKTFDSQSPLPPWLWQIVPAVILFFILGTALRDRLKRTKLNSLPAREFQTALDAVRAKSANQVEFYRDAANFVTTWRGKEGFEEIFEKRDEICFRLDAPTEPVPEVEKNRVLKRLRSLSPILITALFLALQFTPAKALNQDPEKARLETLQEMKAQPAPEHFYNLALCEKALERPAKASLWAYRYKAQDGDASEILEELPGIKAIERKGTDWVTVLPLSIYRQVTIAGAWALAILVCILLFFRAAKKFRFLTLICTLLAPLALLLGGAAWFLYPKEISFRPLHKLSVITEEVAPLQSQPYLGGSVIRENVTGSLCEVIAERAGWVNVELPGGVKGWIQKTSVEPVRMEADSSNVLE